MNAVILDKPTEPNFAGAVVIQCAWCGRVKRSGEYSGPSRPIVHDMGGYSVSHGICPSCFAKVQAAEALKPRAEVLYRFAA